MLLKKLVETSVGVELVETDNKVVQVNVKPTVIKQFLLAHHLDFATIDLKVGSQTGWRIVGNAIVLSQTLEIANHGVILERGKPGFSICGVLSGHVHVVLLKTRNF